MTTDTPRTDAYARHWPSETECVPSTIARQLEREIAASKAEVASLNEQLDSTKQLALKFWKVLEENGFKMELQK